MVRDQFELDAKGSFAQIRVRSAGEKQESACLPIGNARFGALPGSRFWPDPLAGLADASIVAVATTNRYDAVATFDRKLLNRLESFGLAAYW